MRKIYYLLFSIFLFGCQTASIENFNSVKKGMRKDQVLELVGGPKISRRWKGRDRWTYLIFEEEKEIVREIVFKEGQVIYIGEKVEPEISAEEADKRNEESNQAIQEEQKHLREQLHRDWTEYNQKQPRKAPQFTPTQ